VKTSTRNSGGGGRVLWAIALVLAPLVPAILTGWLHPRAPDWRVLAENKVAVARIPVAAARRDYPDALWVDARPADARAAGGVPGAVGLSEEDWETGFATLAEKWDGRRPIVVYCGGDSCHASEAVALRLRRELGFERIVVLAGGWEAWRAARAAGGGP
jgi:rhodanese-related sulfurtransferase